VLIYLAVNRGDIDRGFHLFFASTIEVSYLDTFFNSEIVGYFNLIHRK